ncbi:unnamed protein product [Brachionus calyciflorus]|uniref:Uncharacterized protein n=1 Tax=Brachionus calyciflorus TaxID=104777 RepID=A0A814HW60_9BILA|nr:unnamed protein product [Brachionus calyciflorus]
MNPYEEGYDENVQFKFDDDEDEKNKPAETYVVGASSKIKLKKLFIGNIEERIKQQANANEQSNQPSLKRKLNVCSTNTLMKKSKTTEKENFKFDTKKEVTELIESKIESTEISNEINGTNLHVITVDDNV